jgi:hypothetical protein
VNKAISGKFSNSNTPRDFVTIVKEEKRAGVKLPINTGEGLLVYAAVIFPLDYIVYKAF